MNKIKPKKKVVGEARDVLDVMGQQSEKEGIKWTQYFMDKFEKEEWDKEQLAKEKLQRSRLTKKRYYYILAEMLKEMIVVVNRPSPGYVASVYSNKKGVVAQFKDKLGRIWRKAFKPCGIPKIDHHACKTISGMAEDKMWSLDAEKITEGGVYLP